MKDKFKRAMATGLIALMVANYTACDEMDIINAIKPGESTPNVGLTTVSPVDELKGSVWDAIKVHDCVDPDNFSQSITKRFGHQAIPVEFLQDVGLLYYNEKTVLSIVGNQPHDRYRPFVTEAYVDNNTDANDIYLLVQYKSGEAHTKIKNPGVYMATWNLKYTLDDDDYQTFLKLQGDFRCRYFIQEMDKQYEPEIISKSVISYDLIRTFSCNRRQSLYESGLPYEYVANIDYDNNIITFATFAKGGITFYDVDIRKTNAWEYTVTKDGHSEENRENMIDVRSMHTPIGECLTIFDVGYRSAGITSDQAEALVSASTNIHKLQFVDINSNEVSKSLREYYR